jgi:antagonist of KipI
MASTKTLEILAPGPLTTIQDCGRFGFGRFGVPQSGAVDAFSLRMGNLLVGNRENEAALEITVMGPKIMALADAAIAVTGADLRPAIDGQPIQMWQSHVLRKGEVLSFKGRRSGCRGYLAVGGGISVPVIMGSRSTNLAARFGGLDGRPLKKGDILSSESPAAHLKSEATALDRALIPSYTTEQRLRVIPGPQDHHFPDPAKELFFSSRFNVTPQSDRAGIRLAGPRIEASQGLDASILSEGVVPGAVQVPGDAQPIILLGETVTGGYRKIATVISTDLRLSGQLTPGDTVQFVEVSMDTADRLIREMEGVIRRYRDKAVPHHPPR